MLKIDTIINYQDSYSLLTSHGITDSTATIIDNIYTNNSMTKCFDHLSQFISASRKKLDEKDVNIYQYDYKNFDANAFRNNNITINEQFTDFYFSQRGCIDIHVPIK